MQTFLPYPDFIHSALVLDKKRCWKQVVEAYQIISILEGKSKSWSNHPAVLQWAENIECLKLYFNAFLSVVKEKHSINTKYEPLAVEGNISLPWWLGNPDYHRAMRSRLIEKDEQFYGNLFMEDKGYNDSKYFWPDMSSKTFKII